MTNCGKSRKMKQQRPRIKKTKEAPGKGKQYRDPPQMAVGWGRAGSLHRPGLFTRKYFEKHEEACCADVYYALSEEIYGLNQERIQIGEKPLKRPNYASFSRYFHWFLILGFIERTDRREPAIYDFLEKRVFYTLTDKGRAEVRGWEDPISVKHPEFR